jgi:hypothetical protein
VRDRHRAPEAVAHLRFPLVVKLASAELHKTELDLVRTGIRTLAELSAALEAIATSATQAGLRDPEFLVQEFVEGTEMLAGARADAQFGPIVVAGFGGTAAEVLNDVAIRLLPIESGDASAMLDSLRGSALLGEFRGRPARDRDALVAAVVAVGTTFLACRAWLGEIEINPLIVGAGGRGAYAVDVRLAARS